MKVILKYKWIVAVVVIAVMVATLIFAPNLSKLAQQSGNIQPPDDVTSQKYEKMLKDVGANANTMVAVVQLEKPLNDKGDTTLENYIKDIEKVDGVERVISPYTNNETFDKVVSDDKKTVMLPIEMDTDKSTQMAKDIKAIDQHFDGVYLTNKDLIQDDINTSTDEGLKTTELVTVGLILVILIVVFRSIVTPFVPLLLVGLSYLFSSAVVAMLVQYFNFPVSVYIQPFLVALLFGIGTDYCILLLNRFKEELGHQPTREAAVYQTFISGGKTILVCGITILCAFLAISFTKFELFQSAVGIGIGAICLMIILYTLLPLAMMVLGEKIFWPSKNSTSHKDNKLWGKLGKLSSQHAFLVMVLLMVIIVPIIFFVPTQITYDNTNEISNKYESVKAVDLIEEKFDLGEAFPVQIAIQSDDKLTTKAGLNDVESVAKSIDKIEGVKNVNTITRPMGSPIEALSATYQLNEIQKKLSEANEGLGQVNSGLGDMQSQVEQGAQQPQSANPAQQAQQLSQGLQQAQQGNQQVMDGQQEMQQYLQDMANDPNVNESGMYISDEAMKDDQMKQSMDQYSADQGQIVLMNVELEHNPYKKSAFSTLDSIKHTLQNQINGTVFEGSTVEYGGVTSQNQDLDDTINHDMNKVIILMSLVTFIVLVIFKRSIIMPLYMMFSIIITYYLAMALGQLLFVNILHADGILLMVPFFSLVILFALGIDYAIFLLNRFNEEAAELKNGTISKIPSAFEEVLGTKPFDEMTINDICDHAMIHRSTFYRYFVDKYELLDAFSDYLGGRLSDYLKHNPDEDFEETLIEFVYTRRRLFNNTIDKYGNPNKTLNEAIAHVLLKRAPEISEELNQRIQASVNPRLYARFFAIGVCDVIGLCIRDNKISKEELKQFIKERMEE